MTVDAKGLEAAALEFKRQHRNCCYPEALGGEASRAAQAIIEAYLSARSAEPVAGPVYDGSIEVRLDDKGGVDEIVGLGVICHVERMSSGEWFFILTRPDQSQEAFWLSGKGKVEVSLREHRPAPTTGPNAAPWTLADALLQPALERARREERALCSNEVMDALLGGFGGSFTVDYIEGYRSGMMHAIAIIRNADGREIEAEVKRKGSGE